MRPAFLLVLAACGRVGFDAAGDAAVIDAAADAPAPGCAVPGITSVATSATVGGSSVFSGSCGGESAPELVLPFDVPAGTETIISADDPNSDTVVYVADTCPPAPEIACDDDAGAGNGGMLSAVGLAAGRHYAFIDGQQPSATIDLTGRIEVLLPGGAACTGVPAYWRCGPELVCTGGTCTQPATCAAPNGIINATTSVTGSTAGAQNLHASTCGPANNGGKLAPERYYRIDLASAVTNVHMTTDFPETTYDTLLYVRSSCFGGDIVCEDDNANGTRADLDTGPLAAGSYYVFVDGFSYRSGAYRLDVTITP